MPNSLKSIGKYTITGIAGKGAMGIVYIGYDPFVDRKVAIKVSTNPEMRGDSAEAVAARHMFFNEAKAAGALDHPNILRIYEAGEADGMPYISMEFLEDADDLKTYCKTDKLLPLEQAVDYFIQAANALAYAHEAGVTHRDIKPPNLMLNNKGQVKICDFGIAQRATSDATQMSGWYASPMYMSPEQAKDEDLDHRTDIFSLGVLMYEMLTGKKPFEAKSITGLIFNVINKDPPPLEEVNPDIPEAIARIVHKALSKSRDARYQTAREMAEDLSAALSSGQTAASLLSEQEKLELLAGLSFFEGFTTADLKTVMKISDWLDFPANSLIIEEGDTEPATYSLQILVSGEVSIQRSGREINTLTGGECFGEMAYLSGNKRSASVIAITDSMTIRISAPLKDWASLPVQMLINKRFQQVLIERLNLTSHKLARKD